MPPVGAPKSTYTTSFLVRVITSLALLLCPKMYFIYISSYLFLNTREHQPLSNGAPSGGSLYQLWQLFPHTKVQIQSRHLVSYPCGGEPSRAC